MVMFELIGIIIFLIIANHYGKKIPDTGKYSRERQLKNITKRVKYAICMIVIMTDCCLSFYKA